MEQELNLLYLILSFIPLISILTLIMGFKWGGGKAGAFSWFIASIIGLMFFGADLQLIAVASLKGLWTTVFILYIYGNLIVSSYVFKLLEKFN